MNALQRIEQGMSGEEDAAAVLRLVAALVSMMQSVRPSDMVWIDYQKALAALCGVLDDDDSGA